MDEEPEPADTRDCIVPSPMIGHVVFHHVTFGYDPDKTILRDINLYAKPGQKIAFVGSTGAGKTTITNLLNRFYDIQAGSITIDGVDIRTISRDALRSNIAMVLQDTHLFTGTVRENIRYGSWTPRTTRLFRRQKQPPPTPLSCVFPTDMTPCWRETEPI